jgi:hypothetical protein
VGHSARNRFMNHGRDLQSDRENRNHRPDCLLVTLLCIDLLRGFAKAYPQGPRTQFLWKWRESSQNWKDEISRLRRRQRRKVSLKLEVCSIFRIQSRQRRLRICFFGSRLLACSLIISFIHRRRLFSQVIGVFRILVLCDQALDNFLGFIELAETVFEGYFSFVAL